MDIVVVAQYMRDIANFEENNSRFVYLTKLLAQDGSNRVEVITSDFNHLTKRHFERVGELADVKVTALHEPGYPKNVCLKRFASHKELAKNVGRYLRQRQKPDVCYCAVPSLDVADTVSAYCEKNDVRFVVDIQDLWPEAFKMVFNLPVVSDLIFAPMQKKADRIYSRADHVVAVSKTYAQRAVQVNRKDSASSVVYLGTEKETFDRYAQGLEDTEDKAGGELGRLLEKLSSGKQENQIRIAYCGTLGHSYDIGCVLDAIRKLDDEDRQKICFIIMGDGPRTDEFVRAAEGLPVVFTGRIAYPDMVWVLKRCDIAVNPISRGAAQSIINKHMDYAMAGLPVISTQECAEYRELLQAYGAGINCECDNSEDVRKAIKTLIDDKELRIQMGMNSRKLGTERFDRMYTYKQICELLKSQA